MFAITFPADLALLAAVVAAWFVLLRLVAGDQPVDLAALFGDPAPMPWPRGVQEEEPRPWRLELLDRRPADATPGVAPDRAPAPATQTARAGCATG